MKSRVSFEEVFATYQRTGSVWKAGKELGLAGQTIHERLRAGGVGLQGRKWSAEEDAEMRTMLENGVAAGEIGHRLGRTFAGVTCHMNELGLSKPRRPHQPKLPRGIGLDKAGTTRHFQSMLRTGWNVTRYCRSNGFNVDTFVLAIQTHLPGKWEEYVASTSDSPPKECAYCGRSFYPANGKQATCSRKCQRDFRVDRDYFNGERKNTIGLAEGQCQLCSRKGISGLSSHHILGKENDPENKSLIALCRGCHQIVGMLATRTFVDEPSSWESLIQLAWMRRHGAEMSGWTTEKGLYTYVEIELEDEEE